MWVPNIAALSAQYRTYALDTINDTGLSVRRQSVTKPEQLINWLDEVLAVLIPDAPINLVGMSYGGWLACQYALHFPARVRRLVLLAPAATVRPVSVAFIIRAALTLLPSIVFRRQFYYWLLRDTVRSGAAGRAKVDEIVADWAVAERCFGSLPAVPATVLKDAVMASVGVPCLFLVGENEKIYSARQALERLNRVAPQIETELIADAGHDLWMAQADVVTSAILRFLAEREA